MKPQTATATAPITTEKRRSKTFIESEKAAAMNISKTTKSPLVQAPGMVTANIDDIATSAANPSIVDCLVSLRDLGTAYYENFVVAGRKAVLEIVSQVYAQFYAAKSSSLYPSHLKAVRQKLEQYQVKIRSTSSDASLFIRLVFKDFDDKQVSVYSRSLIAAFVDGVTTSEGFTKYIEKAKGGFYGVVLGGEAESKSGATHAIDAVKAALHDVSKEQTVETIPNFMWHGDEEHCVLVAFRGVNDDSARLKKIEVSDELFAQLVTKYSTEKRALLKKTVDSDTGATKVALQAFKNDLVNLDTQVGSLEADLNAAVRDGNSTLATTLRGELKVALMRQEQTAQIVKQLKAKSSTKTAEAVAA